MRVLHARHADLGDGAARSEPVAVPEEVRIGLSGNLCRCTGYDGLVRAVLRVATETANA